MLYWRASASWRCAIVRNIARRYQQSSDTTTARMVATMTRSTHMMRICSFASVMTGTAATRRRRSGDRQQQWSLYLFSLLYCIICCEYWDFVAAGWCIVTDSWQLFTDRFYDRYCNRIHPLPFVNEHVLHECVYVWFVCLFCTSVT